MNTNLIAQVSSTLRNEQFQANLREALPANVSLSRFTRVTLTAMQQNPDILTKDKHSLYLAVTQCAQVGLMPDGKEAALVAFGNKVQFMPMIGGLRRIAAKYGVAIATGVVHEHDTFDYALGVEPVLTHKPAPLGTDRGKAIGVWAEAKDADGNRYLEVMDVAQVEAIRAVSRAKGAGPWVTQWGEMARKTVARRLWKSLPLYDMDERDSSALAASDAEFEFTAPSAQPEPAAARSERPSALQRVVDAEDAEFTEVGPEVEPEPTPAPRSPAPVEDDPF